MKKNIYVTQPTLPPLDHVMPYLKEIWQSKVLTNGGQFHTTLEKELSSYLGVPYISLFSNCTIGLMVALKALGVRGEVITTPYSFVATAHSIVWNNLKPVFVDIDPITLNLDPKKIEAAITDRTTAIMPVHVYGVPCDVDAIDEIAKRRNLKVIYDAAHAFGVSCHCGSVLNHGDLSVLSFHATKVFNTFEGGAIACKTLGEKNEIDRLKNFGFENEISVGRVGINGKMSEFNAAIGLAQLPVLSEALDRRAKLTFGYVERLSGIAGITCHFLTRVRTTNFGYFPIFIEPPFPITRDELHEEMARNGIYTRRYFYPLISEFPVYRAVSLDSLPVAKRIADTVLCLPIYPSLSEEDQDEVVSVIRSAAYK